ncbi:hypothetical protein ACEPAH_7227 [Sanghuangporus vaninii]
MHIYDLSHKLDESTQVYPGDPTISCRKVASIKNDGYSVTSISLGSHSGTHIDAPCHFFEEGKTIDELDLSALVGPAVVIDISDKGPRERITWDDLVRRNIAELVKGHSILLVRTGWSIHWKTPLYLDHPFFDTGVARNLIDLGVRVFCVDTLNPDETLVDGADGDFGVHETILGSGAMIVENLTNLDLLPIDHVHVSLVPLALTGCDGSPIRAVAWAPDSRA